MRNVVLIILLVSAAVFLFVFKIPWFAPAGIDSGDEYRSFCFTGAFIADLPGREDIRNFKQAYGKNPYYVMVFIDWENYPDMGVVRAILDENSVPVITWEPWYACSEKGVDPGRLLQGEYDGYIKDFAGLIASFGSEIYIRFAHEMNGDWYPWSGSKIGALNYIHMYRYVKDICDRAGMDNARWIFSVNWEDIPATADNSFQNYYPGDEYVDYIGLDGYNWGDTKPWSGWMSFRDLFDAPYRMSRALFDKPVLITEFSSASSGGDKALWIREAMIDMRDRYDIEGFVLFNVDKETDWKFRPGEPAGLELRRQLRDSFFRDKKYL